MSRQQLNCVCKKSDSLDLSEPFKSNFDEVVETIALESKKCNYNPKIDMNWCNLPTEIRLECLKHLDFKTRCGFRGVSKTEKALVDSKKYQFEHLQIFFEDEIDGYGENIWDIEAKSGNGKSEIHIRTKGRLNKKCLSAIFRHAEVKSFLLLNGLFFENKVRPILEQLAQFAPFPFKRVSLFLNPFMDFFMQNCPDLEKIDVYRHLPYNEMLSLPSLMKIKEFKLVDVKKSNLLAFLPGLVQKWIDNDVEAGKLMQFDNGNKGIVNMVAKKFADRIIEKTDKELRIRMNNEKTQILMRILDSEKYNWGKRCCSCKVIPIDLPKSEYATGDEWIQAVYERYKQLDNPKIFEPEDYEIWRCL